MPPRGKESFVRRQKEIARQQKAKEKAAKREERRTHKGDGSVRADGDLSPDDLISVEQLTGLAPMPTLLEDDGDANTDNDTEASPEAEEPRGDEP